MNNCLFLYACMYIYMYEVWADTIINKNNFLVYFVC